jgi:hypothetical protein
MPVVAMFVNESDEMSNLYRGHAIDASYQVSLHLAEGFQRRRLKCEKLTDDRRRNCFLKQQNFMLNSLFTIYVNWFETYCPFHYRYQN